MSLEKLIIISKYPIEGVSKKRLGDKIGYNESASLAKAFLDDLIDRFVERYATIICGRKEDKEAFNNAYEGIPFVSDNRPSHLGDILAGIRYAFSEPECERAILVVSDAPTIKIDDIEGGFQALKENRLVIGPSQRKIYLLGLNRNEANALVKYSSRIKLKFPKSSIGHMSMDSLFFALKKYLQIFQKTSVLKPIKDIDTLQDMIDLYHDEALQQCPRTYETMSSFAQNQEFLYKLCCNIAIDSKYQFLGGPKVGAVIIKNGKILSYGSRFELGLGKHAEYCAIIKAKEDLKDAEIYVTLEPCNERRFNLKPCASLISNAGIRKIIYGSPDTNLVQPSKAILESIGIEVVRPRSFVQLTEDLVR